MSEKAVPDLVPARVPGPVSRLLVANRGEIVSRVFATCRRLGISTVAVYSDADAGLPYVREASLAVRLPGTAPSDTYLRIDLLLDAARRSGADAIHPGYGFLSESADFAQAVIDAGLTWIGPAPDSIRLMGSKVEAKRLMAEAGVPVLNSVDPAMATVAQLPLLVKASAGGGGRGMRIVRDLGALPGDVAASAAEAESAFGDPTVFVEPFVEHGRHVEVQVWGDHSGSKVSVLGARDCSIQRRHQKVVEESPPPGLDDAVLEGLYSAARSAASAISYVGAGTVEFLVDADDPTRFWFLEMNTRLQVEHPVTEAVLGVDLVELQLTAAQDPSVLEVGAGQPDGHAIEVRLYAEDPAAAGQPQSGRLRTFEIDGIDTSFVRGTRYGVRCDAGVESGSEVSTYYDAMLAKLVAWAPTRDEAARRLAAELASARLHGMRTNREQLVAILRDPDFLRGEVSTDFLDTHPELARPPLAEEDLVRAAGVAAVALALRAAELRTVQRDVPLGWRNVRSQPQLTRFRSLDRELEVAWRPGSGVASGFSVSVEGHELTVSPGLAVDQRGVQIRHEADVCGLHVDVDWPGGHLALEQVPLFTDPTAQLARGSLLAPMPGTVVRVDAARGETVAAGQVVVVLEAMKMQHPVAADQSGVVTELPAHVGRQVAAGEVLAVVEAEDNVVEGDQG